MTSRYHIEKGEKCLNCHEPLDGENFCPNCGQLNNSSKPTFKELLNDLFLTTFSFDSKFHKTLFALLFKPGVVSYTYFLGKRGMYTPPVRLLVIVIFLFLAIHSISERIHPTNYTLENNADTERLQAFPEKRDSIIAHDIAMTFKSTASADSINLLAQDLSIPTAEALQLLDISNTWGNRWTYSFTMKIHQLELRDFFETILSNIFWYILCFLPFIAAVLKLIYFRKKDYFYVDHFVYSMNLISVYIIIFSIASTIKLILNEPGPSIIPLLVFLVIMYISMLQMYKDSKMATFWKLLILSIIFAFLVVLFVIITFIVAFILY